jgi:hypothetical protein
VTRIAWMFTLVASIGCAQQNMDVSFMFGPARTSDVVLAGTTPGTTGFDSGSIRVTFQTAWAKQFYSTPAGNLYVELPITFGPHQSATIPGGTAGGLDRASTYFTPGLRLKIPTATRISFYGAVGGGIVIYGEKDAVINGQLTAATDPSFGHPVADFAGGVDLRLSHWVSLRAEGRDFIAPAGLGGTAGHNHPLFLLGFAFHL